MTPDKAFIDELLNRLLRLAVQLTRDGYSVKSVQWKPPRFASESPYGAFEVTVGRPLSASEAD